MKRIISSLAALVLCASAIIAAPKTAPEQKTAASDSRITYVGRTLVKGNDVSFDWTATTVRVAFNGDYLAMRVSDTKKNYYNVWIDKDPGFEADMVIATSGNDSTYVLVEGASKKAAHRVTIQKRTEGEQGTTTIHEFITRGELLQAEPVKDRLIEFIGDSYTCGYGSENSISTDHFTPATENCNKSYAAIVSRYFNADWIEIAHSGMGVERNYNDKAKFFGWYMPERYLQTFDEVRESDWKAADHSLKPDVTVIYLGANDFSTNRQPTEEKFVSQYLKLIKQIKDNYGEEHPIVCLSSKRYNGLFEYVRKSAETAVREKGFKNVYYYGYFLGVHHDNDDELGADSHPNYTAHKKLAHVLIPYISTCTGWNLEDKVIK